VARHLPPEELLHTRALGIFAVKGKSHSVEVVEVFGTDNEALRDTKAGGYQGGATLDEK
jgi:hypothetical protein